jgi:cell wall-associated NlpC family hydrolase
MAAQQRLGWTYPILRLRCGADEQARAAPSHVPRSVFPLPMPPRFRSLLLAFALAAFVFGWAAAPGGVPDAPLPAVEPQVKAARYIRKRAPKPSLGERAAKIALKAVGVPYRWGGSSPSGGFDCSGLVYWAYGRLGIEVPHSSYALYELGRRVPRSRLKPGDLLFFTGLGHMGMYLGGGRMVHAPQSGRNVEIVTLRRSHYGDRLVGARRIAAA